MADEVESGADVDDGAGSTPDTETDETSGAESTSADESGAGSTPAAASTEDEPEEFKNALAKHGGDKAKLSRHYWQTQQDNARLAKELEQARAGKSKPDEGRPRVEKEPEPEPDLAPELKELETYLGSLEEQKKALPEIQSTRLTRVVKANEDLIRAQTRLEAADEMDKPSWEQKVRLAELHKSDAARAYAESRDREQLLAAEIARANRERAGLKRHLDSEKERQEQADAKRNEFMESFPAQIDRFIEKAAEDLNVPKDKDLRQGLWEAVNESLMVQFWRMKDVPQSQIDVPALVRKTYETALKRNGLGRTAKFGQVSTDKLKVTKPAAAARPTVPDPKRQPMPYEINEDPHPQLTEARKRLAAKGL